MKKISLLAFMTLLMFSHVFADTEQTPQLNTVTYRLTAEQWVSTTTAKVTVSVDATLSAEGMAAIQQQVMNNLANISPKGDWHITVFNRNQDQSGLESVYIEATARLPEDALATLRDAAKNISRSGETYRIANIEFTPSLAETEKVRTALRNEIYLQAKAEIATLNKTYSDQKYFLHSITFSDDALPILPPRPMMLAKVAEQPSSSAMAVSNKLIVTAEVVVASVA